MFMVNVGRCTSPMDPMGMIMINPQTLFTQDVVAPPPPKAPSRKAMDVWCVMVVDVPLRGSGEFLMFFHITPSRRTNMAMENHHFLIGDASSNGWFSGCMFLCFLSFSFGIVPPCSWKQPSMCFGGNLGIGNRTQFQVGKWWVMLLIFRPNLWSLLIWIGGVTCF